MAILNERLNEKFLGINSWAYGVREYAVMDTSTMFPGLNPHARRERYEADRRYSEWTNGVRSQVGIVKWMTEMDPAKQTVVPVIADVTYHELLKVNEGSATHMTKSLMKALRTQGLCMRLRGSGKLPEVSLGYVDEFTKDGSRSNDAALMAAAYTLYNQSGRPVTVVADDWDFNNVVRHGINKARGEYQDGLRFETPDLFVRRHGITFPEQEEITNGLDTLRRFEIPLKIDTALDWRVHEPEAIHAV